MPEFNYESGPEIESKIRGKTIKYVTLDSDTGDDFVRIYFTDEAWFEFRYDRIYDWEYSEEEKK